MKHFLLSLGIGLLFNLFSHAVIKLNSPFSPLAGIQQAEFSTSQTNRLIYLANPEGSLSHNIFSVDVNNAPASTTNLTGPLTLGGNVLGFILSSDGNRVVFLGDKDTDNINEVYSVPVVGGVVNRINDPLINGGDVTFFAISPDNTRVAYSADQETDEVVELYSAPITGGGSTKLSGALVAGGDVKNQFKISSNSFAVVFRADKDQDELVEIYSVPLIGGGITKLNGPILGSIGVISGFKISPNNNRVVYVADQDTDGGFEIYSSLAAGGDNIKLNGPLVPGGFVDQNFQLSPEGSSVLYYANQDDANQFELYLSPIEGGNNTKISGALVSGGNVLGSYAFTPNGARVVYLADQSTDEIFELYSSLLDGSGNVKISGPLVAEGDVEVGFKITPDSSRVIYRADQETNEKIELFSASILGGNVAKLNGDLVAEGDVENFQLNFDGSQVVYEADQATNDIVELFLSSTTTNFPNTKLNDPLVADGNVQTVPEPFFNFQGDRVVYVADQETDETFELYLVNLTTNNTNNPLLPTITSPLAAQGVVNQPFEYTITAQGGTILGFGATNLPVWATLNSNIISGIPTTNGVIPITLFATNASGVGSALLTLTIHSEADTNVVETVTGFNSDFNGDGAIDLLTQKKTILNFISLSSGSNASTAPLKSLTLTKKDKVRGANRLGSNHVLIAQNQLQIKAIVVDSNLSNPGELVLGSVSKAGLKIKATGDLNGDSQTDIIVQQGKTIGALLSPNYSFATVVSTKQAAPKVVGVLPRIGSNSNAVSSILLAKGKKLFYYDIPTNAPFVAGTQAVPQTGPVMDKAYKVSGIVLGTNAASSRLILVKGKKVGLVNYGITTLGNPSITLSKKLGKVVGPK